MILSVYLPFCTDPEPSRQEGGGKLFLLSGSRRILRISQVKSPKTHSISLHFFICEWE